ncbi:MAG: hypothetical protein IPP81_05410 [Chitinophagaceae bacterium]|nr:hypothetical protein [Chitinophagaceae bacterium]
MKETLFDLKKQKTDYVGGFVDNIDGKPFVVHRHLLIPLVFKDLDAGKIIKEHGTFTKRRRVGEKQSQQPVRMILVNLRGVIESEIFIVIYFDAYHF